MRFMSFLHTLPFRPYWGKFLAAQPWLGVTLVQAGPHFVGVRHVSKRKPDCSMYPRTTISYFPSSQRDAVLPHHVFADTDSGDDIDDALARARLLRSQRSRCIMYRCHEHV